MCYRGFDVGCRIYTIVGLSTIRQEFIVKNLYLTNLSWFCPSGFDVECPGNFIVDLTQSFYHVSHLSQRFRRCHRYCVVDLSQKWVCLSSFNEGYLKDYRGFASKTLDLDLSQTLALRI